MEGKESLPTEDKRIMMELYKGKSGRKRKEEEKEERKKK